MSNPWAIAAVTAVMRHALQQQLGAAASGGILHDSDVISQPPDRVQIGSDLPSRLNLFLYEITNNEALSNDRLPRRSGAGTQVEIPQMTLRLRYLLMACGAVDFENEILLAHGLQTFNKTPVIPRSTISAVLDPALADGAGIPPQAFREEAVAIADQFELLRITPVFMHFDEMSKIWAGLQSAYRPSLIFEVSVVIVEETRAVHRALPVLRRGSEDRGWDARANLFSSAPVLLVMRAPDAQPAALADGSLTLIGAGFTGTGLRVRFRQDSLGHAFEASGAAVILSPVTFTPAEIAANSDLALATQTLTVDLSAATIEGTATVAPWAAGLYAVEIALVVAGGSGEAFSNQLSVAIAPAFATSGGDAPSAAVNGGGEIEVTLHCSPPIQARQTASIMVGSFEFPPLTSDADVAVPVFTARLPVALRGATHPLRLRVAGVDSQFIDRSATPPAFAAGHTITIPA